MGSYIKVFEISAPPDAPKPSLNISVGNGVFYITVSDPRKEPKLKNSFKYNFKPFMIREFLKICKEVKEGSGEKTKGLVISKWLPQEKKMGIVNSIYVVKNERDLYMLRLCNPTETYEFPLVANSSMSIGSDILSEVYRSDIMLNDLIESLNTAFNYLPLSRLDGLNNLGNAPQAPSFEKKQFRPNS